MRKWKLILATFLKEVAVKYRSRLRRARARLHESTPESLAEQYRGWTFRYYDGHSFDEDGNPLDQQNPED